MAQQGTGYDRMRTVGDQPDEEALERSRLMCFSCTSCAPLGSCSDPCYQVQCVLDLPACSDMRMLGTQSSEVLYFVTLYIPASRDRMQLRIRASCMEPLADTLGLHAQAGNHQVIRSTSMS